MATKRLVLGLALVVACTENGQPNTSDARVTALQTQVQYLQGQVNQLQSSLNTLREATLKRQEATVVTDGSTYGLVTNNFGAFAVVCNRITPFLDGYKLYLSIGNLTSVWFNGAKLHVSWGLPWSSDLSTEQYQQSQHEEDVEITQTLRPGAYTQVVVTATPAIPAAIHEVTVGITLNKISMP